MQKVKLGGLFLCFLVLTTGCDALTTDAAETDDPLAETPLPNVNAEALPTRVPFPADNVNTTAKVELGRLLFWDPILSGEKDVSCASCHHPQFGYADGRALSLGVGAVGLGAARRDASSGAIPLVGRNAPTVLNTAFNGLLQGQTTTDALRAPMFWDARARSLETQALAPIRSFNEMRGHAFSEEVAVDSVLARLNAIPEYVGLFQEAFNGTRPITMLQLARALAAFERSLVMRSTTPFDRYAQGDDGAMTAQQLRGFETFKAAGCDDCHSGPMFSDFALHRLGVAENAALDTPDDGDGAFRFRTPSLRNVTRTAPYMHNGTLRTLDQVMDFYRDRRSRNPNVSNVDDAFRTLRRLNQQERSEVIAFLASLTHDDFDQAIPARVPSGLPVGGNIY